MRQTTYGDDTGWRAFNRALPADIYLTDGELPEEQSFAWRNCIIHVDRYVRRQSPVHVVLLHGVGTNARSMSIIAGHHLAAAGYDVAAVDMPYFGATQAGTSAVSYDDWVSIGRHYVDDILPADGKPVVVFGFSAGGMLGYHISCQTNRIAGICGTCFLDMRKLSVRRAISATPSLDAIVERVGLRTAEFLPGIRLPLHLLSNMRALTNDRVMTKLLLRDQKAAGVRLPLGFLKSFLEFAPAIEPQQFEQCPIELLHPEDDRWTPRDASADFLQSIKGQTRIRTVEGSGHLPITTASISRLRRLVLDFVDASASGSVAAQCGRLEKAA